MGDTTMNKSVRIKIVYGILLFTLCSCLIILAGCSGGIGNKGGLFKNIVHEGVFDRCTVDSGSSSSSSNIGDKWTLPGGTEFELPEEHRDAPYVYEGINYSKKGYWIVKHCDESAPQFKVLCDWYDNGRDREEDTHLAKLNGRYLIAMKPKFGTPGDSVDVKTNDGKVIPCILGDIKGEDGGGDEWAHGGGSVVEFIVACDDYNEYMAHKNPGNEGCHPEWQKAHWIRCYGNVDAGSSKTTKNKCKSNSGGGNDSIANAAVSLCYECSDKKGLSKPWSPIDSSKVDTGIECSGSGSGCNGTALKGYNDLRKDILSNAGGGYVCECSSFVPTAIRWAGADDNFPRVTSSEIDWCELHNDKWELVGKYGASVSKNDLKPGDVFICDSSTPYSGPSGAWSTSGHVFIFCGNEAVKKVFPDSNCEFAEASLTMYGPIICDKPEEGLSGYGVWRNKSPEANPQYKNKKLG